MKEISLHILDIVRNSIDACAQLIKITINEDTNIDLLKIEIEDDGKGIDKELLGKVTNPFITTRKTRKVGLGLSLAKESTIRCDGDFSIYSQKGKGTKVTFSYKYSHIDRAPLGDMGETIMTIISFNSYIDILYTHVYNGSEFILDTKEIKSILGEVNINTPKVLMWIKEYINENIFILHNLT